MKILSQDEPEFKSSTEMNQYYRAMMSEEARAEEDFVICVGIATIFVIGFLVLLTLGLGIAALWAWIY